MFPYGELILYTLSMVAWVERHPSRRILGTLIVAWIIGKIVSGYVYNRPWHIHGEWLAVLIVIVFWSRLHEARGYFALFWATLTLAGQYLLILNEPGIIPYQELLFPLMWITITRLAAHTYWDLAFALCGALLINQFLIVLLFQGIILYQELPDPHYWQLTITYLCLKATVQRHSLWSPDSSLQKLNG